MPSSTPNLPEPIPHQPPPKDVVTKVSRAIERVITHIPETDVGTSPHPDRRARKIAQTAAVKAAVVSGSLALPPGPLGVLTILPDLVAIWRIQSQMVADIAGCYGHTAHLTREEMLYCLFRHAAAQAVRDVVARVGGRLVVKHLSTGLLERMMRTVGVRISQRVVAGTAARWLPLIGALGVGAYAYYDTGQVARTAMELFARLDGERGGTHPLLPKGGHAARKRAEPADEE